MKISVSFWRAVTCYGRGEPKFDEAPHLTHLEPQNILRSFKYLVPKHGFPVVKALRSSSPHPETVVENN